MPSLGAVMEILATALAIAGLLYFGRRVIIVDDLLEDLLYQEIVLDLRSDGYAIIPSTWARGGKNGRRIKVLQARLEKDFPTSQWELRFKTRGDLLLVDLRKLKSEF